jgi:tape measure domain-containing protein
MNVGSLEIKLFADLARLQSDMDKANKTVDAAMRGIDKSVTLATRALGGLGAAVGVGSILKTIDEYKRFDSQLKLATKSATEYAQAYGNVVRIARESQSDIKAVGVLYARLAQNLAAFGTNQREIGTITEAVALSLRVSNATVQETSSVMLQLSQSFGSGRINGQEFLAVSEGAPIIMRQLVKSLRETSQYANITYGDLKDLSSKGLLDVSVLKTALSDPAFIASLREQAKTVGTVSSAIQVLKNNVTQYIGEADKAGGSSNLLIKAILGVGDAISLITTTAIAGAIIALGRYTSAKFADIAASKAQASVETDKLARQALVLRSKVTLTQAEVASIAATNQSTLAMANNAALTTRASVAMTAAAAAQAKYAAATVQSSVVSRAFGGVLNFLGGPLGLAITLIGGLTMAYMKFADDSEKKLFPALDRIKDKVDAINAAQRVGVNATSPVAKELTDIRNLDIQRDNLFKKLQSQQASAKGTDGKGGLLSASMDDIRQTAIQYSATVKELALANDELNNAQKRVTESTKGLDKEQLKESETLQKKYQTKKDLADQYAKDQAQLIQDGARLKKSDAEVAEQLKLLKADYDKATGSIREQKLAVKELTTAQKDFEKMRKDFAEMDDRFNKVVLKAENEALDEKKKRYKEMKEEFAKLDEKFMEATKKAENKALDESIKAARDAKDKILKDQQEAAKEMNKSIVDAIFRGFESGKSFAQNFKETLINTFKTLVLRPIISAIVDASGITKLIGAASGALSSVFSGTASAATGGGAAATGGFGGVSNLLSLGKSLFTGGGVQGALISSIEGLGTIFSNGMGGLGDAIGGFLGANAGMISNVLPFAGAALQLLSGNAKGAAWTAAGAAIGSFIPIIGTALGGMIGGLIGSFFGSKKPRAKINSSTAYSIYGGGDVASENNTPYATGKRFVNLGADKNLNGLNETYAKVLGSFLTSFGEGDAIEMQAIVAQRKKTARGIFSSSVNGKVGYQYDASANGDAASAFNAMAEAVLSYGIVAGIKASNIAEDIKALFDTLTDKTQVSGMLDATMALNASQAELNKTFGITLVQSAKAINATQLEGQAIVDYATSLAKAANEARTVGEVLYAAHQQFLSVTGGSVLQTSVKAYDELIKSVDKTTASGIDLFNSLFSIREQFKSFTQTIDGLKGGVKSALFSMVSDAEKQAMLNADLAKIFGDLNMAVPGSIEELIQLGKSIDYTTAQGLNLAAVFPSLVQAFNQTQTAVESLMNTLRDESKFKTLVDFQRYTGVDRNYGTSFANNYVDNLPSFATGTNMLPTDMTANVHAGERIVPAADNRAIIDALNGSGNFEVKQLLGELITEVRAGNVSIAKATQKTAKIMERIEDQGIILSETNNDGERVVLDTRVVA